MKKNKILTTIVMILLCTVLLVSLSACSAKKADESQATVQIESTQPEGSTSVFQKIDSEAALKLMSEVSDYRLIDVRTKEEFDDGHIKGAELMPLDELESLAKDKLTDLDQTIILYCRSGNRSGQASELLKNLGYTKIYDLGGIIDWTGDIEK